jgi:hypothetical protein
MPRAIPAPTWLYVWFWVGLVPSSLLLGPVWPLLNPLRALTASIAWLSGDPRQTFARRLPEGLGYRPAAVALFVFVWLELVYSRSSDPLTVFVFLALYSIVQLLAADRAKGLNASERGADRGLWPCPDRSLVVPSRPTRGSRLSSAAPGPRGRRRRWWSRCC